MAKTPLTAKQQQVFDLINKGKKPQEIATTMKVSKAAVYAHMRGIKEAGQPLPEQYANVGTTGRGGRGRPIGGKPATKNGRRTSARGGRGAATPPTATPPPSPTAPPAPTPVEPGVNVDEVFAHLRSQIEEDRANIEARRGEIRAEVESLTERIAALGAEEEGLSAALARLANTEAAVTGKDAAALAATATGNGTSKDAAAPSLSGA